MIRRRLTLGSLTINVVEMAGLPEGTAVMFDAQDVQRGETWIESMLRQAREGKLSIIRGISEESFS